MGKIRLAVTGETLFAGRLTECIQKHAPEYLEVISCRTLQELPEFLAQLQPDILLCEQGAMVPGELSKHMVLIQLVDNQNFKEQDTDGQQSRNKYLDQNKDLNDISSGKRKSDPGPNSGEKQKSDLDHNGNEKQKSGLRPEIKNRIFRYQRGSEILRQIFQIYEQNSKKNLVCRCKTADMEMTAFYAPGGHELLLPFSISYAAICGEDTKVLYLNLSEFSGMRLLFGNKEGNNLSDLIFGIRQKKERFLLCLQSVLHHAEQFDYVLPPENPEDLYEIQEADLACLLTLLQEQTAYKKIIWNCGTLNQTAVQVMECCGKVFCVMKENAFGKYRKAEFEVFLKKELRHRLREKVQYVYPQTGSGAFVQGVDILTQLQNGEFAKEVRRLIEETDAKKWKGTL